MNLLPLTSLPRTGSTLLLYILNQNPTFQIGPDSEIGNLLNHNKHFMMNNIHHFQLPTETVEKCYLEFCRKGTESWVNQISNPDKIFVDKSRHWLKDLSYIFKLFPDIKIIITIRDLRGMINSFEKINNYSLFADRVRFHQNASESTNNNYNVQIHRIRCILDLPYVKEGIFAIKELIDSPKKYKDQIKICRYEDLTADPKKELDSIYDFLQLEKFNHDFNNIEQGTHNDNPYQPYGCHTIKSSISNKKSEEFSELSREMQNAIVDEFRWYYNAFYPEVIS